MKSNYQKLFALYRSNGIKGLVQKTLRYITNWRMRRDDILWLLKRIHVGQYNRTTKVHGLTFYVHYHDPGISKELAIYHTHEPEATRLFKSHIKEDMCVVDIGSNIGYYVLLAATIVGPKGKVLAIEPAVNNHQLLIANARVNKIKNVEFVQCAIGDKDGVSKFYITEASNTSSLIPPINGKIVALTQVKTRRLDTLLKEHSFTRVDFVRMDIEGAEVAAVDGMRDTLKRHKPTILAELHCDAAGTASIVELLQSLRTFGYAPQYVINRDLDFVWMKKTCIDRVESMSELIRSITSYRVATVLMK